jgi:hypothetical protein
MAGLRSLRFLVMFVPSLRTSTLENLLELADLEVLRGVCCVKIYLGAGLKARGMHHPRRRREAKRANARDDRIARHAHRALTRRRSVG